MDWTAFGLSRDPFQRCPELDDACLPNAMAAQLSELLSGLRSPQGVSVLVGDAGSGKSIAAEAFARRLRGVADVALVARPTSSALSIARDVLSQIDPEDHDFRADRDWPATLRERARRCGRGGRATVVLLDNAHRLSPQSLEDLAELLGEDESVRLHLVLLGRPALTEKMDAGARRALDAHLLQICHLEPLGVRQSVRYLERRLAICGGDLGQLFTADAIDEIVQTAGGRLVDLEEVACEALRRASGRGSRRASSEDVVASSRSEQVGPVGAVHQQPLRFAIDDEEIDSPRDLEEDRRSGAGAGPASAAADQDDEEGGAVEWGDDEGRDEKEWLAEDAEPVDGDEDADDGGEDLDWEASSYVLEEEEGLDSDLDEAVDHPASAASRFLDHGDLDRHLDEDLEEDFEQDFEEDEEEIDDQAVSPLARRLIGPAVISVTACLALMWAANNVPGPDTQSSHGRDSKLFAEKLSSDPAEIMRLARTVEAADADAHVVVWRAEPRRPAHRKAADQMARASAASESGNGPAAATRPAGTVASAEATKAERRPDDDQIGGRTSTPTVEASAVAAAAPRPRQPEPSAVSRPPATAPSPRPSVASRPPAAAATKSRVAAGPVFTVQLGAFKTRRNAEVLAEKLRDKSPQILESNGLYRVVSGAFSDRREAAAHEAALKRDGYSTFVRSATF